MDPESGRILDGPHQPSPVAVPAAVNAVTQDLREIPGTTQAGGFKVDLGDRFFHHLTVGPDEHGAIQSRCESQRPASAAIPVHPKADR